MKKSAILLFALLMVRDVLAQSCLPQGITFNWQTEIDNFQSNYPGCTHIEGNVTISSFDITNLNGLSVLTSIGGTLSIYVDVLSSLAGLENLTSIGGDLIVQNNDSLANLAELVNLTSIGNLWLRYNHNLASLSGLDNLSITGGLIWIFDNDTLSACAVQSICNYLAGSGTAWIENNSTGCNSREEVEADCGVGFDEKTRSENKFYIYPNPSSTKITLETSTESSVSILNLSGQQLIIRKNIEPKTQINISALPSGVYLIKLINNKTIEIVKLIKE
jgi:hypothetical protein